MKIIERDCDKPIFQGDIMIVRVSAAPGGAKEIDDNVIAHSETGHDHTAECATVLGGLDPMVMFLRAKSDHVDIVHHRSFDTHETLRLLSEPGDVFVVKRQREYTPDGWRRVED